MKEIVRMRYQRIDGAQIEALISTWPTSPRNLADALIASYGMPHEATQNMLIWHFNGPWKRTILHKTGSSHNVPHPHTDLLEQTIETRIPVSKHDEIAEFDGSILIDRTRGEMTAFCENERMNTMILNLAHDIAIGTKTPQQAVAYMKKYEGPVGAAWPNPYSKSLQFTSTVQANNPDMVVIQPN